MAQIAAVENYGFGCCFSQLHNSTKAPASQIFPILSLGLGLESIQLLGQLMFFD